MKLKRVVTSISASFDGLISHFENHEAVSASMLNDMRRAEAKIKTEMAKVLRQIEALREKQKAVEEQITLWERRALHADNTQEQSLACVHAAQNLAPKLEKIHTERAQIEQLQRQLNQHLHRVQERLFYFNNRRAGLIAKKASDDAARSLETAVVPDMDDMFDRWEASLIGGHDAVDAVAVETDALSRSYEQQEQNQRAMDRLQALREQAEKDKE